jgi:MFS family permease
MSQLTVMVHIVPLTTDLGFAAADAAKLIALIGASSIVSRIVMGAACDKIGAKWSFVILMVVGLVALVWLQFASALWMLFLFSIIFGYMYGGMVALQSLSATELFGQASLGAMVGSFTFAYTVGGTVGPVFGGYVFDTYNSYTVAFIVYIFFALLASITAFLLRPPQTR